jgi:hypothetical protein
VCATCSTCGAAKYAATACGGSSDTVCASCALHCTACTGPAACTACSAGYASFNGVCVPVGTSCSLIRATNPAATDGVYQLDPDGGSNANAFFAYCDMTADGGGWMKILQISDAAYTPSAAAIGTIATAGITAAAKLDDTSINSLSNLGTYREYRFQGATSTKKLFMKASATWNDVARGHGLILGGTGLACEAATNCAYVSVTTPVTRPTIDSNDWSPSSIGSANNADRYFTDYSANPNCYVTGSTSTRCYDSGLSTGHALIQSFSIWTRELPAPAGALIDYRLDENSGTAIGDSSGNARGATLLTGSWTPGHHGSSVLGALRTSATVPASTAVTVSAWVRRDGAGIAYPRVLSWTSDALEIGDAASGDSFAVYTPSTGWRATGHNFGAGFHHVAVTVGAGTLIAYFDGAQVYTTAATINLSGLMSIGTRWNDVESWDGAIDQVLVYDRVLTAAEIVTLSQQ